MGATVLSTTRNPARTDWLRERGVDHPIVDTGRIADTVRTVVPDGVDAALELVGMATLRDTLASVREHGTGCFTGALGGEWTVKDFSPFGYIPFGVRLTTYGGGANDLPAEVFAKQLDAISEGRLTATIGGVYRGLDQVRQAQADLEAGEAPGKHVVVLD